jgi:benzoylformate decarboxylase
LEYIFAFHEDISVGMAAGYSERMLYHKNNNNTETLPLGIANLDSTPGLMHGLGNIFNSKFQNIPLLIITGSDSKLHEEKRPTLAGERERQLGEMFKYSYSVSKSEEIPYVVNRATKEALTKPYSPVYINIPYPVQEENMKDSVFEKLVIPSSPRVKDFHIDRELLREINSSKSPRIIVGSQLHRKNSEYIEKISEFSDRIDSPIYGECTVNSGGFTNQERWVRTIGLKESPSEIGGDLHIYLDCNTVTPLLDQNMKSNYDDTTIVYVSEDLDKIKYKEEVDYSYNIDVHSFLQKVNKHVKKKDNNVEVDRNIPDIEDDSLENLCSSLNSVFSDNCVLYNEGVSSGGILMDYLDYSHGQFYGLQGGGLGLSLPASAGLRIADEEVDANTKTLAFIGDGSFNYYPQTIHSVSRHIKDNYNVMIPNNNGYRILQDNKDNPKKEYKFKTDIEKIADSYGVESKTVEYPYDEDIRDCIESKENMLLNLLL